MLIEGCYIRTGDDAIAIKAGEDEYGYGYGVGSHNITVRDCVLSSPCAAFAIGSEMSGGVSHVRVSNCRMWDSTAAVHIKSGPGRGGFVRDVVLEQLQFDGASEGFMIDLVSTHQRFVTGLSPRCRLTQTVAANRTPTLTCRTTRLTTSISRQCPSCATLRRAT